MFVRDLALISYILMNDNSFTLVQDSLKMNSILFKDTNGNFLHISVFDNVIFDLYDSTYTLLKRYIANSDFDATELQSIISDLYT